MRRVVWLHPDAVDLRMVGAVPEYGSTLLCFPMMDVFGNQSKWRRYAKGQGWDASSSGALTIDIRSVWPNCMFRLLLNPGVPSGL